MAWRVGPHPVDSDIPADIDGMDPMAPRAQVLQWASRQLAQLNKDAGPAFIHQQIIRAALQNRGQVRGGV